MKFYYVYVLESLIKDFIYVGFSTDLKARFKKHNNKEEFSTKPYAPFELIHYEAYRNQKDAKRREDYFKTTKGKTTLKMMLKEYFEENSKPPDARTCPICNGKGEAANDTAFYMGNRYSKNVTICLTCKGKGWIVPKKEE